MTTISPRDIATQLPVILSRVAQGEEFVVTDQGGQAVARIVPPAGTAAKPADADHLGPDHWRSQFDTWMRDVDSRADRYPDNFALDDGRE